MKKLCFFLSLLLFSLNIFAVDIPRGVLIEKTRDGLKISMDNRYPYRFITIFYTYISDDGEYYYETAYVEKGFPEILSYSIKEMNSFEVIDYNSRNISKDRLPAGLTYYYYGENVKFENNSRNNYCIVADITYGYTLNDPETTHFTDSYYMESGDEVVTKITSVVSADQIMGTDIHIQDVTIKGVFVYEVETSDQVITFNMYRDASTDQEILGANRQNTELLLQRINVLFEKAGIKSIEGISAAARVETKNGAPSYNGLHNYARAIDIKDSNGRLYQAILPYIPGSNLRMEDRRYTQGWVHLDIGRQRVSGKENYPTGDDDVQGGRVFIP
jgi:hypothetical protein